MLYSTMSEENVECFSKEEMSVTQDNQERAESAILDLPFPNIKEEEEMEVVEGETLTEKNEIPIDEGSAAVMQLVTSIKQETGNDDYSETLKSEHAIVSIKEDEDSPATNYQVKVETTSIEAPLINSYYSTSTNTIVKTELDLGVTTRVDLQQSNNIPNVVLTSDSICPNEPPLLDPFHDVDPGDQYKKSLLLGQLLCKLCDYRRNTLEDLTIHEGRLHTKKYNYRCFICATKAYDKEMEARTRNRNRKKKRDPVVLTYNQYEHESLQALKFHVGTVHRGLKLFQCPTCKMICSSAQALKRHRGRVHKEKIYECRYCSFKCEDRELLETHWYTHFTTFEHCPVCNKKVSQLRLSAHINDRHKKGSITRKSRADEKETCQVCGVTGGRDKMSKHYKNSRHAKPFLCSYCDYGVISADLLKKHLKTHKLQVCPFPSCGKQFYVEREYNVHLRLHSTKLKIYKCFAEECEFETVTKLMLDKHYRKTKHHYRFKCQLCFVKIRTEGQFRDHVQLCKPEGNPSQEKDVPPSEYHDQITHFSQSWLGIQGLDSLDSEEVQDTANPPPENSVEAPENSVEAPENSVEAPENSVEAPENSVEVPENSVEAPENSVEAPENSSETPEDLNESSTIDSDSEFFSISDI